MATQAPNPRDFASWEDAFQHPIPVVRKLEQQLRVNVNENREKLRSLVGASYRDLLGTAERIIDMDSEMQQMETILSDVGRKCNARSIESIATSQAKMARVKRETMAGRRGLASGIALLQACMRTASRLVKRGEKHLLAAKLVVLSRLLFNDASRSADAPAVLESLRTRLGALRRTLLAAVDRQLTDVGTVRNDLLDALTAFSLATSSTPTDVLRHFLHVRQQSFSEWASQPGNANVNEAVDMIFFTLEHAQAIFPKRLSDALARLKSFPLLHDPDVREISDLDLDIYERWISDDVRTFTPWPRHDELQHSQTVSMLEPWAKTACQTVLDGLDTLLVAVSEPQKLSELRENGLRHVLAGKRVGGPLSVNEFVRDLRDCFGKRLNTLISKQACGLTKAINEALQDSSASYPALGSLWDPALADMELRNGAVAFRSQLQSRSLGKDGRLQRLCTSLDDWTDDTSALRRTIKTIKDTRWDDDLDFDDANGPEASSYQDLLSKEDSESLSTSLDSEIRQAFADALKSLGASAAELPQDQSSGTRAMFLLRITREVLRRRGSTTTSDDHEELLATLHAAVAEHVVTLSAAYRNDKPIPFGRAPAVALWEGSPALPAQPSPAAMRLLHELRKAMQSTGTDLWTTPAVDQFKRKVAVQIKESIGRLIAVSAADETPASANGAATTEEEAQTNGESPTNGEDVAAAVETATKETSQESTGLIREKVIQALYDTLYLERLLAPSSMAGNGDTLLQTTVEELQKKAELEASSMERVWKSTTDYHKRTYLLFGILAPPS